MRFYRVTELVRLKEKDTFYNYAMLRGMEDGKRLHSALRKVWEGKDGYIIEQQEIIYFYSLKTGQITGGLIGTPDMGRIKDNTLYIIDHKSINSNYPIEKIDQVTYGNQVFLLRYPLHHQQP